VKPLPCQALSFLPLPLSRGPVFLVQSELRQVQFSRHQVGHWRLSSMSPIKEGLQSLDRADGHHLSSQMHHPNTL
jgi:hypothetical protein